MQGRPAGYFRSITLLITFTSVEEDLSMHPTPPTPPSWGRRPGLQSIPRRFLITGTLFAMGRKGQLKPLSGLNRDGLLFRGPTGLRFDGRVEHVDFPGVNHRFHGRPVGRKARGLLPFAHRARTYHLKMPANSPSEYLGPTTLRKAGSRQSEYTSGDASPSPAGPVHHANWVFVANQPIPCPKRAGLSKAEPLNPGMGARFGVNPERPS